jgi:hypothetical protein
LYEDDSGSKLLRPEEQINKNAHFVGFQQQ